MTDTPPAVPVPATTVEAASEATVFPLSSKTWFQIFDHAWRPAGGWVLVATLGYAFIGGPIIGEKAHLNDGELWAMVGLVTAMWGLKTFEKVKTVPSA